MNRETIVLLPGMMCDARLFAPQIAVLEASYDIVVGNLTGHSTIEGLAEAILASTPSKFSLAGLSMGGIVALAMVGIAPHRIRRLALLDTNHLADAEERRSIRDRQIAAVAGGGLRAVVIEEMKPVYLAPENRCNRPLLDVLVAMAMDLGPEAFITQSKSLRDRGDQSASLQAYTGPVLVLHGESDQLCPPELHDRMAALSRHAELVRVPRAGHISTLENPSAVTNALRRWLSRTSYDERLRGHD